MSHFYDPIPDDPIDTNDPSTTLAVLDVQTGPDGQPKSRTFVLWTPYYEPKLVELYPDGAAMIKAVGYSNSVNLSLHRAELLHFCEQVLGHLKAIKEYELQEAQARQEREYAAYRDYLESRAHELVRLLGWKELAPGGYALVAGTKDDSVKHCFATWQEAVETLEKEYERSDSSIPF